MPLRIDKLYSSLQSRGKFSGFPTTFIEFTNKTGKKKSVATIMGDISKMKNEFIFLTGVNPLSQEESISLVYELIARKNTVTVETDCSHKIDDLRSTRSFSYAVNVHCPSSGKEAENVYSNIVRLSPRDEIRFAIENVKDYEYAKATIRKYPTKADIFFTPANDGEELMQWLVEDKIHRVRYESNLPIPV